MTYPRGWAVTLLCQEPCCGPWVTWKSMMVGALPTVRSLRGDPESREHELFGTGVCKPQKRGAVILCGSVDMLRRCVILLFPESQGAFCTMSPPLLRLRAWSPLVARGCHSEQSEMSQLGPRETLGTPPHIP